MKLRAKLLSIMLLLLVILCVLASYIVIQGVLLILLTSSLLVFAIFTKLFNKDGANEFIVPLIFIFTVDALIFIPVFSKDNSVGHGLEIFSAGEENGLQMALRFKLQDNKLVHKYDKKSIDLPISNEAIASLVISHTNSDEPYNIKNRNYLILSEYKSGFELGLRKGFSRIQKASRGETHRRFLDWSKIVPDLD